jgi:hypothetical protein
MRAPLSVLTAAIALAFAATAAPAAPVIQDADTQAWWALTSALSGDDMEGRDTGSAAYERAAHYVADQYAKAGLKPAGDNGTWFQTVPLHEVSLPKADVAIAVAHGAGAPTPIAFLQQITVRPTAALPPSIDAPLVFRGYCSPAEMGDAKGKMVVCFGTKRAGLPGAGDRLNAAAAAGAVGLINVDDPYFDIEPPRWPAAYARAVTLKGSSPPAHDSLAVFTLSADAFAAVIAGSGQDAAAILKDGGAKKPLPAFDIPARLQARFKPSARDMTASNVLGILPGTDPKVGKETLVVSAHLDGFGYGEPVKGDNLYNGAFDDAAYVATLIRLAQHHQGHGLKRSILFAAFTGEEKLLLGATWFTRHPTVPKADLIADINLDQLRPLFPLKILTVHALEDTSLGASVRAVAQPMGIAIRPDLEPERGLLRRADQWPFLEIGVPATAFIFGYDPGGEPERRYREWYQVRYHRPQDDLTQPFDPQAAADFNRFFYTLAQTVANAPERPAWSPTSPLKPKAP